MKAAVSRVAVALAFMVSGCAGTGGSQTSSDCSAKVRADGIVYTSNGYTERRAAKHSSAEEAVCQDMGPDAAGTVFPELPRQVTTWTFADYPPGKVLGVQLGNTNAFAVFVADSIPPEERDRIYEELGSGAR